MFPKGPRTVTVAYTNSRSGITVLIEHQTVYRYRWNRKDKVFYVSLYINKMICLYCQFNFKNEIANFGHILQLARKSPQQLTKKMPVYPRAGFQWIDGNQVLVEVIFNTFHIFLFLSLSQCLQIYVFEILINREISGRKFCNI